LNVTKKKATKKCGELPRAKTEEPTVPVSSLIAWLFNWENKFHSDEKAAAKSKLWSAAEEYKVRGSTVDMLLASLERGDLG
jgi:hypothetical protein